MWALQYVTGLSPGVIGATYPSTFTVKRNVWPLGLRSANALLLEKSADVQWSIVDQWDGMENLDKTIRIHCEALTLYPPGHANRSLFLNSLANVLQTRFDQLGRIEDLEAAISSHREALTLCPPGHPNRSSSLIYGALAVSGRKKNQNSLTSWYPLVSGVIRLSHGYSENPWPTFLLTYLMFSSYICRIPHIYYVVYSRSFNLPALLSWHIPCRYTPPLPVPFFQCNVGIYS